MTRTTALSFATAIGFAATLAAQTPTSTSPQQRDRATSDKHEITITGCLSKGADGNYMLTNATEEKSTTTTAGTTGTTAAEASKPGSKAMTWKLEGGSDLDRHVGHKIEVTGKTEWKDSMRPGTSAAEPPTTTGTTGTTSANEPKLDVSSVKMVSSSCS